MERAERPARSREHVRCEFGMAGEWGGMCENVSWRCTVAESTGRVETVGGKGEDDLGSCRFGNSCE